MSERRLTVAIAVLSVVGIGIAGYLTWVHYGDLKPLCLASGGCEKVQSSRYAELGGVSVALIGLVGYVAILGSLLVRGELGRLATALLAFVGVGFSAYLTYRELFTIKAVCQWCVASAIVIAVIAVLAAMRVWRAPAVSAGASPAAVDP